MLSKKNRADDTRPCISLLSVPAVLSMKRTFSFSHRNANFASEINIIGRCLSCPRLLVPTHAHSFFKAAETS